MAVEIMRGRFRSAFVLQFLLPGCLCFAPVYATAAPLLPCNGFGEETVHIPVRGDASDAFQYKKTGITYSGSSGEIYVGRSAYHGNVVSALRFTGVQVPKDAHILSANVRLVDAHAGTVCCKGKELAVLLRLEQAADSTRLPRHHAPGWLLSRLSMTPSVVWQPPATDTFNETDTPELGAMLQAVVNLQGWKSGNAVTLLMDGEGEANDVDERVYFGSAISFTQHRAMLRVRFCRPPPPEAFEAKIEPMCPPARACEACPGAATSATMQASSAGVVMMADAAPQADDHQAPRFVLATTLALAGAALSVAAFVGCAAGAVRRQRGSCLEDELDRCLAAGVDRECCGGGDSGL